MDFINLPFFIGVIVVVLTFLGMGAYFKWDAKKLWAEGALFTIIFILVSWLGVLDTLLTLAYTSISTKLGATKLVVSQAATGAAASAGSGFGSGSGSNALVNISIDQYRQLLAAKDLNALLTAFIVYGLLVKPLWCLVLQKLPGLGKREPETDQNGKPKESDTERTRNEVATRIRLRARLLRVSGALSFGLIVMVLLIGFMIFISTDNLILDADTDEVDQIKKSLKDRQNELDALKAKATTPDEKKDVEARLADLSKDKDKWDIRYVVHDPVAYTVASVSTRLGSALLLFFLVKILVILYRYNMRLAAFYDGTANAIQLAQHAPDKLKDTAEVIVPINVAYDEVPKAPHEDAMKVLESLKPAAEVVKATAKH